MVKLQNHDNEFSLLFEHVKACEAKDGVVMISDTSREELDEIRVLREAVQETMEIPQVYFTQS